VAASPAETPLVVLIIPPKTIAELLSISTIRFANNGLKMVTITTFTTPAAILRVITLEEAPTAFPVIGPIINVHVPTAMVAMLLAS
jgi:hypothetical protein